MIDNNQRAELIVRNAIKLPYQDRAKVAQRILDQPEDGQKESARKRYALLLSVAEEVFERKMTRSRSMNDVMIRRFIAYKMRKEGYYLVDIAKAMGMDHSTIVHYVKQMKDCFDEPIFYAGDIALYMRFSEYVEDESKD